VTEPATAGASITVGGLCHRYRQGSRRLTVLDQVSFEIEAGDHIALTGPSGAGKSTLLGILGGIEQPQEGSVRVDDMDLRSLHGRSLAAYRRSQVGFVFQSFGLVEALTAQQNVELALALDGVASPAARTHAVDLLTAVGLGERAGHRPVAMSGGERQRVAIARALVGNPRLLLADEPTGNLDGEAAATVLDLLEQVSQEHRCTLVVVTHNPVVAARARRHLQLRDGRLVAA
jgi:putative ABC transport system ATP-binding protein